MSSETCRVVELSSAGLETSLAALSEILHACVLGGASVNFVLPFSATDARAFWTDTVLPGIASGERRLLAAWIGSRLAGTVQLVPAPQPNQRHRADIAKLLVHPEFRRRGVGQGLMTAVEELAASMGRTLVTLDTVQGHAGDALYQRMGYQVLGTLPGFALAPDGRTLEPATFFYKYLKIN